jgi:endonuclease YncB( thermonuclease family)
MSLDQLGHSRGPDNAQRCRRAGALRPSPQLVDVNPTQRSLTLARGCSRAFAAPITRGQPLGLGHHRRYRPGRRGAKHTGPLSHPLRRIARLLPVLLMLAIAHVAIAAEITGRVVGIADGDTLTVLEDSLRQTKIRLAEIDTPESRQPYGSRAKQALSDLVFGKSVRVVTQDTDRYGRTVGRVYTGALDVNAEMVRQGAAWVYRKYNRDKSLIGLEQDARDARRGLWALPEAERTPPWEWRSNVRYRQDR